MKIRSVHTISKSGRFEHQSSSVVLEHNGIEYTISEHRERAGAIIVRSTMAQHLMMMPDHSGRIVIGVDQIDSGLVECDGCGDLVSSVREITSHNDEAPRFLCRRCIDDEPETDQPPPELSPRPVGF